MAKHSSYPPVSRRPSYPSLHCCSLWAMCPGSASCHRLKPGVDWSQQSGWRLILDTLWKCIVQQCGLQGRYSRGTAERAGVNCQRNTHVIANAVRDYFIRWAVSTLADTVVLWWTGFTVQLLGFILQQCVCYSPWEGPGLVFNERAWWALAGICVLTQDGERVGSFVCGMFFRASRSNHGTLFMWRQGTLCCCWLCCTMHQNWGSLFTALIPVDFSFEEPFCAENGILFPSPSVKCVHCHTHTHSQRKKRKKSWLC